MKRFLIISFLALAITAQAQISRGLKGDYNTERFPEISFIWNTADPNIMNKSQFVIQENDKDIDFKFAVVNEDNQNICKKSILFLWEDMYTHRNQSENTRLLLLNFFSKTLFSSNDRFNVAVFNRIYPGDEAVIHLLHSDFINDADRFLPLIRDYKTSKDDYKKTGLPLQSDLYLAINEGIDLLKKEPSDRMGVIVVVTAGLNMKASGATTEMETVRKKAVEAGIPIYVVKYHELQGNTPEVNTLADNTYGQTIKLTNGKVDDAVVELQSIYKNMDSRFQGRDYKFTFTTAAKRDGKSHRLRLIVNKVPQPIRPFTAPQMTFGLWVKENLMLFIVLVILLIGLIIMTILLLVNASKKRKQREAAHEAQIQRRFDVANQERVNWEQQQAAKEVQKQAAAKQKASEEEAARLLQLMQTKNMFPRLQCTVSGETFSYLINKPVTKLGRSKEGNDVILNNQTVSKYHAEIRFSGSAFEVVNMSTSYKQGVIVNGQFFQKATLKSGDLIGLGEAVVTFYV